VSGWLLDTHVISELRRPHPSARVRSFIAGQRLEGLLFLPPYSPELSPAEHLWEALREDCFANTTFAGLDAVVNTLTAGLRVLEADPERIQSMTGFNWITSISLNAK